VKVLVSTKQTQGQKPDDFSYAREGDIVCFGEVCARGGHGCGCERSMVGIKNRKSTTTMRVAEFNLTRADWIETAAASEHKAWYSVKSLDVCRREMAKQSATIESALADVPAGTIIEYRNGVLSVRKERASE